MSRIPSSFDLVLDHDVSLDGDTIVDPGSVGPKAQVASVKRAQTMLPPRPRSSKAPEPAKPSTRRPSLRFEADLAEKTELMALPVASAKSQVSPPRAPTSHEPRDTKGSTQRMHVSQLVAARRASTASVPAIAVEAFRASSPSFPLPQRPSQPADSLAPVASPLVPVASDSLSAVVGANDESWSLRPEDLGTRSPFAKKAWAAGAIACALGFLGLLATAGGKPTSSSMASQPTALSTSVVSSPTVPSAKAPSLAAVVDSRLAAPSSKPDFELEETPSPVKPAAAARASMPVVQAPVVDARAKTESKAEKASRPEASAKQGKGTARGTAKGEDAEAAGAARIHAEANTAIADTL